MRVSRTQKTLKFNLLPFGINNRIHTDIQAITYIHIVAKVAAATEAINVTHK